EQSSIIEIAGGRHPVVEQSLDGDNFIPNDTNMDAAQNARILLLTGPNMAGKSTYLRQIALITLLAQIGCFVPARNARIGLVDRIFTRVGAEDDIASGKSTFMVEMEETATILHHATRHSLIILDEIGRGTSTYDGLAIARAVVEHLHGVTQARTLFATHYHELASMAGELPHLRVYTMAISNDEQDEIIFLHHVIPGSAGRSYGVHVAKLAGMPLSVVRRAGEVLKWLEGRDQSRPYEGLSSAPVGARFIALAHNGNGMPLNGDSNLVVAEKNVGARFIAPANVETRLIAPETLSNHLYAWQTAEARLAAHALEQANGSESDFNTIDLCAITPLDALNLLFLMQKKRKSL
ncbi:MAG TPA: hypothetical protein VKR83_17940, partial [Ktedonobacteraceae bacterium]|nr:hypothetical protein [Ktedonobacteraceae bacterium]